MSLKKQIKLNCKYHFGISNLNNSSLVNRFYPDDLPEDWHFSYYINEFELLLLHLSDLNLSSSWAQKGNKHLTDSIIEQLTILTDDIEGSVVCLFDCAKLSQAIQQQLYENRIATEANCFFINLDTPDEKQDTDDSIQLKWGTVRAKRHSKEVLSNNLFCHVKSEGEIKPVQLRALIESAQNYVQANNGGTMSIIFSSDYALENCRNAILLESMM